MVTSPMMVAVSAKKVSAPISGFFPKSSLMMAIVDVMIW
jgi:hypothetical protein